MLVDRTPVLAAFTLSFVLVARICLTHHRRFNGISSYDNKLQVGNLWMLFFVVFLPVPTSLLFQDGSITPWPPVIYALTVAGLVLAGSWTWRHAYRTGLMHKWVDGPLYRLVLHGSDPVWSVFLLSIPVAFVNPSWAMYSWILIWPASVVHGRWQMALFVQAANREHGAGSGNPTQGT
jgi:uncharacterized membrane protein